jgi:predicted transcriptional regulator
MIHHLAAGAQMPARKVTPNSADRLTVTLDADDRAALDKLSAETDRSLAWIVRDAVRQYLAGRQANANGKAE